MSNSSGRFEWKDVGDIARGRPNLGEKMHVAVYRMFQFSFRSVLEQCYGKEAIDHMLVEAGRISGREFGKQMLDIDLPPDRFFGLCRQKMEELGIGRLRVEHADLANMIFILTVSEDLDCSGVPVTGEAICKYDEGLIMGILELYTGRRFLVKETDCWSTGSWTCRFHIAAM
jgi:predicted hydrocarbon binding protein